MDKDLTPLVSVILPVYNAGEYLAESINSILNQSFRSFELLIFNDGSTDNSLKIMESFKDERITIFNYNKNQGYIRHLNYGIQIAIGKYIARMDADDISHPDRLQHQFDFLQCNPDFSLVSSDIQVTDENNTLHGIFNYDKKLPVEWQLVWRNPIAHPTAFFRRSLLKDEVVVYNDAMMPAEDYELWSRLIKKGNFKILDEPLLNYRVVQESAYNSNKRNALLLSNNISYNYVTGILQKDVDRRYLRMTEFTRIDINRSATSPWSVNELRCFCYDLIAGFRKQFEWSRHDEMSARVDLLTRVDIMFYDLNYSFFRRFFTLLSIDYRAFIEYIKMKYLFTNDKA